MRIPLYQIDAFAERPFAGNPAAVCPLESWLSTDLMQAIAAENNLSETAFFVAEGEGWRVRWFTPTSEVDPTLAVAYVIFRFLRPEPERVLFRTEKAGDLTVNRDGDLLALDFPSRPAVPCPMPSGLGAALGREPAVVLAARDYLASMTIPTMWQGSPRISRRSLGSIARSSPPRLAVAGLISCHASLRHNLASTRIRLPARRIAP